MKDKLYEVEKWETILVYVKSLQTAMADLVEFVAKQLENAKQEEKQSSTKQMDSLASEFVSQKENE